jgi:uncharacterized protein (UPF0335 family)
MDGDNIGHALRGYADRVINLHADRDALNGDIREVYKEAKDAGFDTTTLREIVREMRMDSDARNSRYQLLDEYRLAVGILADTPLGQAAELRVVEKPTPFAEQPVHQPRPRGRPRKNASEALDQAQAHFAGSKPMFDA